VRDSDIGTADYSSVDPELQRRLTLVRDEEDKKRRLREQIMRERRFLIPVLVFVLLMFPNFGRAQVVGKSMEPQYEEGDALVVLKTFRIFAPLKIGDVVVIRKKTGKYKGEDLVKRVAFIQNEAGNAPLPKSVPLSRGEVLFHHLFPTVVQGFERVPARQVLVVGDNLDVSVDSRDSDIGPVADNEIEAKVLNR
jgi:signal peptidase I